MNIEPNNILDNSITNNIQNVNMIEISNIYPDNLIKTELRPDQRKLISYLRNEAYSICRTHISYDYIRSVFNKFKKGFVYYDSLKKPVAFCIWKVSEHISIIDLKLSYRTLYIYLICGIKADYKFVPRILDDVVEYCRKNNIQYISLEPVNNTVREYYIKCGFKERQDIAGNNLLTLDVDTPRIPFYDNHKIKIKYNTRRQKRNNRAFTKN